MSDVRWVWINGEFQDSDHARISPFDRGFMLGDGIFETLRADQGRVHCLNDHLNRLRNGASLLKITGLMTDSFPRAIDELLERNNLRKSIARIRITTTRRKFPEEPTIFISAAEYRQHLPKEYEVGWNVKLTESVTPFHAQIKSTSNLPYLLTLEQAREEGYHEALLTDHLGFIAESCTCSILASFDEGTWVQPASLFQLPGTTREQVRRYFQQSGVSVQSRDLTREILLQADTVWLTNALIGIMPIRLLGNSLLPTMQTELADALRKKLFQQA